MSWIYDKETATWGQDVWIQTEEQFINKRDEDLQQQKHDAEYKKTFIDYVKTTTDKLAVFYFREIYKNAVFDKNEVGYDKYRFPEKFITEVIAELSLICEDPKSHIYYDTINDNTTAVNDFINHKCCGYISLQIIKRTDGYRDCETYQEYSLIDGLIESAEEEALEHRIQHEKDDDEIRCYDRQTDTYY